ncbi:MAG: diacylglycerol kinase (ATP) [Planctomycetota bacterium]|jgi:diacylglycerol kinase (ATP)
MTAQAFTPASRVHADAPFQNAIIVANPVAGNGHGESAALELAEGLHSMGASTRVHLTQKRGDAFQWLRSSQHECDLVVSIGGDGTLREVLAGLVNPETPVGILPLGTANALAAELHLPRDVHHALEIISNGRVAKIDAATVNGSLSILVTSIGFDAMTVRELEARRNGPITKLSYFPAAMRALRGYRSPELEIELDGEKLKEHYGMVFASNVNHYGGFMRLDPSGKLDDGMFEIFLFQKTNPIGLLWHVIRGLVGKLPSKNCEMRRARKLRVSSKTPVSYQIDGDYGGETPVELALTGLQFKILIP